jgi:hypothetical protein
MKTIVWNMAGKPSNWSAMREWPELADADISLLSEAPPPPRGVKVVGRRRTVGLERPLGSEFPVKREWAALVASRRSPAPITDARRDRYYDQVLPFGPSRPGTWAAARVDLGRIEVTAISLYGLMDERSDASVHRSLSEMAPLFDHKEYRKYLLLGGDLNILSNPRPSDPALARHRNVLDRIEAYGMVDCLEATRPRTALPECPCGMGRGCRHTWTKRVKGRAVAYQDDYLFASPMLAKRLQTCVALPFTDDSPSDHTPIIATFTV